MSLYYAPNGISEARLRPVAREMARVIDMYRLFPCDRLFADSRFAECYGRTHLDWNLNRKFWGEAADRICADAGNIVYINRGWCVDAEPTEKVIAWAKGWVGRRLEPAPLPADPQPPAAGSCPNYVLSVQRSATLKALWRSATPTGRERSSLTSGTEH